jgi:hypothetical protein
LRYVTDYSSSHRSTLSNRNILEKLIVVKLFKELLAFRNTKFHYRADNSLPLVPVLSQINPVRKFMPDFIKIPFNIVPSLAPRLPACFISLKYFDQAFVGFPVYFTRVIRLFDIASLISLT